MILYIFLGHLRLQINNIGLGHDTEWIPPLLNSVFLHVLVELTFHCDLVNSVNVVVHLVRQQIMDNLKLSDLGKDNIW